MSAIISGYMEKEYKPISVNENDEIAQVVYSQHFKKTTRNSSGDLAFIFLIEQSHQSNDKSYK